MSATVVRPISETVYGPAPDRTIEQRMGALANANRIRSRRAQLKRDLKAGRGTVQGLLLDPPEWLGTCKVFDLLLARPKWGRVKVSKVLGQCRISPSKTVGGLSERQRGELTGLLTGVRSPRPVVLPPPRPYVGDYLREPLG